MPAGTPLSRNDLLRYFEAVRTHGSASAAERALGLGRNVLHNTLRRNGYTVRQVLDGAMPDAPRPPERDASSSKALSEKNGPNWTIEGRADTEEELLDLFKVDRAVWAVRSSQIGVWDVTMKGPDGKPLTKQNRTIRLKLERVVPEATEETLKIIEKRLKGKSPAWPRLVRQKQKQTGLAGVSGDLLYEMSLQDHHFGKLCWEPETGNNFDLKIADRVYRQAVKDLTHRVRDCPIAKVLYVVGHDLLHADGANNATTAGTEQDVDGRWQKAYLVAYDAVCFGIEYAAQVAPVSVVVVPGNHDKERTFYLGHALKERYRECPDIDVDNAPIARKRYRWGKVLLGFCHGNGRADPREADLPLDMAQQWKEDWAASTWREWHLGDLHKRSTGRTPGRYEKDEDTYHGVTVRRLPSLTGTDAWHYGKGFTAPQCSEAYLWSSEEGPVATFTVPACMTGTALALNTAKA